MTVPTHDRQEILPPARSDSVLGPADPEAIAIAADDLRERQFILERPDPMPARWLIVGIVAVTFGLAFVALHYRRGLLAWLGWL